MGALLGAHALATCAACCASGPGGTGFTAHMCLPCCFEARHVIGDSSCQVACCISKWATLGPTEWLVVVGTSGIHECARAQYLCPSPLSWTQLEPRLGRFNSPFFYVELPGYQLKSLFLVLSSSDTAVFCAVASVGLVVESWMWHLCRFIH